MTLGSGLTVPVDALRPGELDALRDRFRIPNPAYWGPLQRTGRPPRGVPSHLEAFRLTGDAVRLPRGAWLALKALGFTVRDERPSHEPLGLAFRGDLRPYQRQAVEAFARRSGLLVSPTGSGKSAMGAAIVAAWDLPALIVAPTRDLVAQWQGTLRHFLDVEAGTLADGKADLRPVTVATPQSAHAALEGIGDTFGALVFDEAHHLPASQWRAVADGISVRRIVGLTATPERADGLHAMLPWYLGPHVHRIAHDELAAHGAVLTPVYEPLPTEFRYAYENADDWHGPLDAIVEDRARNALIVNAVTAGCAEGATALVLTGRVAHAALLTAELRDAGLRVEILVGSLKSKERASILDRARSGELQAIVATGLADEGLDVPCLSEVFLTFPAKHEGRLLQRIGRVLRPHPRKGAPRIVDFHDHRVGVLAHQARKRAHTVRKVFGERSAA